MKHAFQVIAGLILALLVLSGFSIYLYQQNQVVIQENAQLQAQLVKLETKIKNYPPVESGDVQGASSPIGTITGAILLKNPEAQQLADSLIVCALDTRSNQEYCTDALTNQSRDTFTYQLEIPPATYAVFALTPPLENKTFYSNTPSGVSRYIPLESDQTELTVDITL